MKKILFSLVTLVCSMSMNAQVMKVMKGNTVVATYTAEQADNVVFEAITTGTAKRTGDIEVAWVQLWEDGPKFAEYNVGVTDGKAESYGGHYGWGMSIDKDVNNSYKEGSTHELAGDSDTATKLWGNAWRMPTKKELQALLDNCDVEWTTVNGVNGCKFTGKTYPYSSNSMFLPAAGDCGSGLVYYQGSRGYYWSSTPTTSNNKYSINLYFNLESRKLDVGDSYREYSSQSVRAVLAK